MVRPIETRIDLWVTMKEAAALRGRTVRTVRAWVRSGQVRAWAEPGGRILVFVPDFVPPADLARRSRLRGGGDT